MTDNSIPVDFNSRDAFSHFKECLRLEVINRNGEKKFSWFKVFHRVLLAIKRDFTIGGDLLIT
jgi:hypothetical protein